MEIELLDRVKKDIIEWEKKNGKVKYRKSFIENHPLSFNNNLPKGGTQK